MDFIIALRVSFVISSLISCQIEQEQFIDFVFL